MIKEKLEYYRKNICPFCLKYESSMCKERVIEKTEKDIDTTICMNYERNYENETIEEIDNVFEKEGFRPAKYYLKNYREI